jgi:hypothetical protein
MPISKFLWSVPDKLSTVWHKWTFCGVLLHWVMSQTEITESMTSVHYPFLIDNATISLSPLVTWLKSLLIHHNCVFAQHYCSSGDWTCSQATPLTVQPLTWPMIPGKWQPGCMPFSNCSLHVGLTSNLHHVLWPSLRPTSHYSGSILVTQRRDIKHKTSCFCDIITTHDPFFVFSWLNFYDSWEAQNWASQDLQTKT